jgi:hypothetical protein
MKGSGRDKVLEAPQVVGVVHELIERRHADLDWHVVPAPDVVGVRDDPDGQAGQGRAQGVEQGRFRRRQPVGNEQRVGVLLGDHGEL